MKRIMLWLLMVYLIIVTGKAVNWWHINLDIYLGMCGLALLLTIIPIVKDYIER